MGCPLSEALACFFTQNRRRSCAARDFVQGARRLRPSSLKGSWSCWFSSRSSVTSRPARTPCSSKDLTPKGEASMPKASTLLTTLPINHVTNPNQVVCLTQIVVASSRLLGICSRHLLGSERQGHKTLSIKTQIQASIHLPRGATSLPQLPAPHEQDATASGGGGRDRTDDLKLAKLALSQLSYAPDSDVRCHDERPCALSADI